MHKDLLLPVQKDQIECSIFWPFGLAILAPEDIADSLTGLIVVRGTGQSYGCRILLIGDGNQNGDPTMFRFLGNPVRCNYSDCITLKFCQHQSHPFRAFNFRFHGLTFQPLSKREG
jgi:hypothetical protein